MTKSDAQNKKKGEKNQPLAPTYLSSIYLEYVKLTNFGKFANMIVGPFKPGLNVVYGANEAGKTTISELIKNVMFGWACFTPWFEQLQAREFRAHRQLVLQRRPHGRC